MTVTAFTSFSLLALVVSAHPVVSPSNEVSQTEGPLQNTAQSIFQSRAGYSPECISCDDNQVLVSVTSEQQLPDFENLDAIATLSHDKTGYDATSSNLNVLVDSTIPKGFPPNVDALLIEANGAPQTPQRFIPSVLIIFFSCMTTLLFLGCVVAVIYLTRLLRKPIFGSEMLWGALPLISPCASLASSTPNNGELEKKRRIVFTDTEKVLLEDVDILNEKIGPNSCSHRCDDYYNSDSDFEDSDEEDRFEDAEGHILLLSNLEHALLTPVVPQIIIESEPEAEHSDPEYLPLPELSTPYSTPPPTPMHTPVLLRRSSKLEMREAFNSPMSTAATAKPLPAWSQRAADAPSLGLPTAPSVRLLPSSPNMRAVNLGSVGTLLPNNPSTHFAIPGALNEPDLAEADLTIETPNPSRRRAYRSPVPELDIAFAIQLRPGIGLGVDSLWPVRFLMAMFGWMTVLIGNNGVRMSLAQQRQVMV